MIKNNKYPTLIIHVNKNIMFSKCTFHFNEIYAHLKFICHILGPS